MLLTQEKIKVTSEMLEDDEMMEGNAVAIPIDPKNPEKGLNWKNLGDLEEEDFDALESYFIHKNQKETNND